MGERDSGGGAPARDDWADLAAAASGDAAAFERLVARHQRRLHRLCVRLLQDEAEAEEAVQEVFLKLYRNAAGFDRRGELFTLLYRIATNHCLNRLRRRRLVRFVSLGGFSRASGEEEEPQLDPVDPGPDPRERMSSGQRWRLARGAIDRLPAGQRAVLLLVRLEGLSYQETADALGITLGAVESRLFRAMRRLETELEEE
jgi:RNA polymerase sigma-70 factor (ECF subfamily)